MRTANIQNPQDFGKVAVVYGGNSMEREVSLWSGEAVLKALQSKGVDAYGIDAKEAGRLTKHQAESFDRVFIVPYGHGGDDGVLQGALEHLNLPFTGSRALDSSLEMQENRKNQLQKA